MPGDSMRSIIFTLRGGGFTGWTCHRASQIFATLAYDAFKLSRAANSLPSPTCNSFGSSAKVIRNQPSISAEKCQPSELAVQQKDQHQPTSLIGRRPCNNHPFRTTSRSDLPLKRFPLLPLDTRPHVPRKIHPSEHRRIPAPEILHTSSVQSIRKHAIMPRQPLRVLPQKRIQPALILQHTRPDILHEVRGPREAEDRLHRQAQGLVAGVEGPEAEAVGAEVFARAVHDVDRVWLDVGPEVEGEDGVEGRGVRVGGVGEGGEGVDFVGDVVQVVLCAEGCYGAEGLGRLEE